MADRADALKEIGEAIRGLMSECGKNFTDADTWLRHERGKRALARLSELEAAEERCRRCGCTFGEQDPAGDICADCVEAAPEGQERERRPSWGLSGNVRILPPAPPAPREPEPGR